MITVFYDGACSVCSKEINYYRKLTTKSEIEWVDLSMQQDEELNLALERAGITRDQALYELHVVDDAAIVYKGVAAFQIIWRQFRFWRWLSAFVGLPVVRPFVGWGYQRFVESRVSKGQCALPERPSQAKDAI